MRWINRLIRQLGLADAIDWLGPLGAETNRRGVEECRGHGRLHIHGDLLHGIRRSDEHGYAGGCRLYGRDRPSGQGQ